MLVQYSSIVFVILLMVTLAAMVVLNKYFILIDKGPKDSYIRLKLSICEMINSVNIIRDLRFFSKEDVLKTYIIIDTLLYYLGKYPNDEFTQSYIDNACSFKSLLRRHISANEIKNIENKIRNIYTEETSGVAISHDLSVFISNMQNLLSIPSNKVVDNLIVIIKTKIIIFEATLTE